MEFLSNEVLLESYYKAIELKLNDDFIQLIIEEMEDRKLTYKKEHTVGSCQ